MPDPANYETEEEWMADCIPTAEGEGMEHDQALAVCISRWEEKSMTAKARGDGQGMGGEPQGDGGAEMCHCPVCGNAFPHRKGIPCSEEECPECGAAMVGEDMKSTSKATKNPGDYLVVEDPEKVSTYHLQVKVDGKPDHGLMGAAWAALHGGYRGNRYEGPDKQAAIDKLRKLYAAEDMETPKSALEFDMLLTKAEQMADGRTRWQARANTGQWDLERERFDASFWADVVNNFHTVMEATTKGECCGMPVPILDIAHYSFHLPAEKRNLARAGYPIKLWQDGQALMAQGYFDDTPLGRAAAKAASSRPVAERRVSVGVWPDWGRVELDADGRRTYKGGRDRAYLDHLAMTAHPVDPGTVLEVKSMTQKQDALDVLGEDAEELVEELESAKTKAQPEGVVVKADEPDPVPEPTEKAEDTEEMEPEAAPDQEPPADSVTMAELRDLMQTLFESFKSNLDERLAPVEAAVGELPQLKAAIDALGATETEKVKAAIDSGGGEWWEQLVKNSVQRRQPVKGEGPQETEGNPDDPFFKVFGGLRKR